MKGTTMRYSEKCLMVFLMAKHSFSTTTNFVSQENSFQEKNATGRSFPDFLYWLNIPAMSTLEESV